jgi:hypothetical protein
MLDSVELKSTVVKGADFVDPLLASPGGPIEAVAVASSFEPSMMARTSRTSRGRWFKKLHGKEAGPKETCSNPPTGTLIPQWNRTTSAYF